MTIASNQRPIKAKCLCFVLCFGLFISCGNYSDRNIENQLEKAGDNRKELEKVIEHYKSLNDTLKLKAAYFLILNMDGQHCYEGDLVNAYNQLFAFARKKLSNKETFVPWDSLQTEFISSVPKNLIVSDDLQNITSSYLIANIDSAFIEWKKPIARNLNFAEFCEFILPYRIADEPLEDWRAFVGSKYRRIAELAQRTTSGNSGCDTINNQLMGIYTIGITSPINSPYTLPLKDMLLLASGSCDDAGIITTKIMRASGVPVGIDFTPNWGNSGMGHSWNVLLYNHKTYPFMGTESNPGLTKLGYIRKNAIFRQLPKVYRKTFGNQDSRKKFVEENRYDVPDLFQNTHMIDVTDKYVPVTSVKLKKIKKDDGVSPVYLCVFNDKNWVPVQYSSFKSGRDLFEDMGRSIVYVPMYYKGKRYSPAGPAILLASNGSVFTLNPDTSEQLTVKLTRKYPEDASNLVEKGDSYELFYWKDAWRSVGKQIADNNYLIFKNAPSNALFLLSDLSKGKQERIFTYKRNRQIWW